MVDFYVWFFVSSFLFVIFSGRLQTQDQDQIVHKS